MNTRPLRKTRLGAAAAEYIVLLALLAVLTIPLAVSFGFELRDLFASVTTDPRVAEAGGDDDDDDVAAVQQPGEYPTLRWVDAVTWPTEVSTLQAFTNSLSGFDATHGACAAGATTISSVADFNAMRTDDGNITAGAEYAGFSLDGDYCMTSDVDFGGVDWKPIGLDESFAAAGGSAASFEFTGTFDGNGYAITGLSASAARSQGGLFRHIIGGEVRNLRIAGNIQAGEGGLLSTRIEQGATGDAILENIRLEGTVSTQGGPAGAISAGVFATGRPNSNYLRLSDIYVDAAVTSPSSPAGGLLSVVNGNTSLEDIDIQGSVSSSFGMVGGAIANWYGASGEQASLTRVSSSAIITSPRGGGLLGFGASNVNLEITRSYVTADVAGAGGLVGQFSGADFLISESYMTGQVFNANGVAGGIIGNITPSNTARLENVFWEGSSVSGVSQAGGLAGFTRALEIRDSRASGSVAAGSSAGGLVTFGETVVIERSFFEGDIEASGPVGGLIAYENAAGLGNGITVTDSFAKGRVTSNGGEAAGLVGAAPVEIARAYFEGDVEGNFRTGGLVSTLESGGTIDQAYATGSVSGQGLTGGLVAHSEGALREVFALSDVTSTGGPTGGLFGELTAAGSVLNAYTTKVVNSDAAFPPIGGISGIASGAMTNVYSISPLSSATSLMGGLSGTGGATATSSYWDTEATGVATSPVGAGRSTAVMQTQANYTGWDFSSIWYPPQ